MMGVGMHKKTLRGQRVQGLMVTVKQRRAMKIIEVQAAGRMETLVFG